MSELTCRAGQKLISGGAFKSEVPAFCIDETEVTQEAFLGNEADRAKSKYELVQKRCDGTVRTDVRATAEELAVSPMNVHVDGKEICSVEIRRQTPTTPSDRPAIEGKFAGSKKPMIYVNWNEAKAYCEAKGGTLPTGEQWEKAARGPQGKTYGTKSGELKPEEANYWHDGSAQAPVDVGSYLPNDYELRDMTGNVWEWTLDECAFGTRCLRGGSWCNGNAWDLRAAYDNDYNGAGDRGNNVGFRCVSAAQDSNQ